MGVAHQRILKYQWREIRNHCQNLILYNTIENFILQTAIRHAIIRQTTM